MCGVPIQACQLASPRSAPRRFTPAWTIRCFHTHTLQAYALYLRVLADAHTVLTTPYPAAGGDGVDDRDLDPQLNVRELQMHYQVRRVREGSAEGRGLGCRWAWV